MIGATPTLGMGFRGLQLYLFHGRGKEEPEHRVLWFALRNLVTEDPRVVPNEMRAVASQNPRVEKPVYHLSVNAAPGEHLTREQWEQVADRVLESLGLSEHQAMVVAHGDRGHEHIHLMVNRVHPLTHKAWKTYRDWPKIEEALRHLERELGLREVPGHLYRFPEQEPPDRSQSVTSGERREQMRTGEDPWSLRMRFRLYPHFGEAESWADLERRLAGEGVSLEARRGGLLVTDGERRLRASRIHPQGSRARLEERFGLPYETWRERIGSLRQIVEHYQTLEAQERDLQLQRARLHELAQASGEAHGPLFRLRDEISEERQILEQQLEVIFGRHAEAARQRLERTVEEQGFAAAAELLRTSPGKLAPLAGSTPFDLARKEALRTAKPAAESLARIGSTTHQLHRLAEELALAPPAGPTPEALRRALEASYKQLTPDLEALYGRGEAEAVLEKLRRMKVPEAVRVLRETPEELGGLVADPPPLAASEVVHALEEIGELRRELARSLERLERHRAEEAARGAEDTADDAILTARRRLDAAYEELERHLAPAYSGEVVRRDLHRVPPRHLGRRLVAEPAGEDTSALPEVRPAALDYARPALDELGALRRDLFQELSRKRRHQWEARQGGSEEGGGPTPSPTTLARWRLDAALERLEDELRPLWPPEHQPQALKTVRRLPSERLRRRLEADPGHLGPLAVEDPQAVLQKARPAFEELAAREREVRLVLDRRDRLEWQERQGAGEPVPPPDPETASRWRRDRLWGQIEEGLRPLWDPSGEEVALSNLRGLPPREALLRLSAQPELLGELKVSHEEAVELLHRHEALFHRLAAADREVFQIRDRQERLQWEHDSEAGRPTAAPDAVTTARWELDRELHRLEEELRPIWKPEHQEEALWRLRTTPPEKAFDVLSSEPARFGELAGSGREGRAVVQAQAESFERLGERRRELFQALERHERLGWEAAQQAGERVPRPDAVTAARWRLDRAWEEAERELRPLWVPEQQEEALRQLRGLEPRRALETLESSPQRLGELAVSEEAARRRAEAHRALFDRLAERRSELLAALNRESRLRWEAARRAGTDAPEPDEVTAARFRVDRAWAQVEGRLEELWETQQREEAMARLRALPPRQAEELLGTEPERLGPLAVSTEEARRLASYLEESFRELEALRRELFQVVDRHDRLAWEAARDSGNAVADLDPITAVRWEADRVLHRLEGELGGLWVLEDRDRALRHLRSLPPREAEATLRLEPGRFGRLAGSPGQTASLLNHHLPAFEHLQGLSREVLLLSERRDRHAWEAARDAGRPRLAPDVVTFLRWQADRARERLEEHLSEIYRPEDRDAALHTARRLPPETTLAILTDRPEQLGRFASRRLARHHLPEAQGLAGEIRHLQREALEAASRRDRLAWEKARAEGQAVPDPDPVTAARWRLDRAYERLERDLEGVFVSDDVLRASRGLRRLPPQKAQEALKVRPRDFGKRRPFRERQEPLQKARATLEEIGYLERAVRRAADRQNRLAWQAARAEGRMVAEPDPVTAARWSLDALRQRLEAQLEGAYGPEQAPRVLEALDRYHPRDAAAALKSRPERFAELAGTGRGPFRSPERKAAKEAVAQAAASLGEMVGAQQHLARVITAAATLHRRGLKVTARAVDAQLARTPDRSLLERQVASLTWKVGYKAASLVLPRPALTLVSAAIKAVRALERGGMELGR